jgi:hypothetical protein
MHIFTHLRTTTEGIISPEEALRLRTLHGLSLRNDLLVKGNAQGETVNNRDGEKGKVVVEIDGATLWVDVQGPDAVVWESVTTGRKYLLFTDEIQKVVP